MSCKVLAPEVAKQVYEIRQKCNERTEIAKERIVCAGLSTENLIPKAAASLFLKELILQSFAESM